MFLASLRLSHLSWPFVTVSLFVFGIAPMGCGGAGLRTTRVATMDEVGIRTLRPLLDSSGASAPEIVAFLSQQGMAVRDVTDVLMRNGSIEAVLFAQEVAVWNALQWRLIRLPANFFGTHLVLAGETVTVIGAEQVTDRPSRLAWLAVLGETLGELHRGPSLVHGAPAITSWPLAVAQDAPGGFVAVNEHALFRCGVSECRTTMLPEAPYRPMALLADDSSASVVFGGGEVWTTDLQEWHRVDRVPAFDPQLQEGNLVDGPHGFVACNLSDGTFFCLDTAADLYRFVVDSWQKVAPDGHAIASRGERSVNLSSLGPLPARPTRDTSSEGEEGLEGDEEIHEEQDGGWGDGIASATLTSDGHVFAISFGRASVYEWTGNEWLTHSLESGGQSFRASNESRVQGVFGDQGCIALGVEETSRFRRRLATLTPSGVVLDDRHFQGLQLYGDSCSGLFAVVTSSDSYASEVLRYDPRSGRPSWTSIDVPQLGEHRAVLGDHFYTVSGESLHVFDGNQWTTREVNAGAVPFVWRGSAWVASFDASHHLVLSSIDTDETVAVDSSFGWLGSSLFDTAHGEIESVAGGALSAEIRLNNHLVLNCLPEGCALSPEVLSDVFGFDRGGDSQVSVMMRPLSQQDFLVLYADSMEIRQPRPVQSYPVGVAVLSSRGQITDGFVGGGYTREALPQISGERLSTTRGLYCDDSLCLDVVPHRGGFWISLPAGRVWSDELAGHQTVSVEGYESAIQLTSIGDADAQGLPERQIRLVQTFEGHQIEHILTRTNPFRALVGPALSSARQSDFGSSGGRVMLALLGENPRDTVTTMSTLIHAQLLAEGVNPADLSLEQANELVGVLTFLFAGRCGALPGAVYVGRTPLHPVPYCPPSVAASILRSEWPQIEALLERDLEEDRMNLERAFGRRGQVSSDES